MLPTLTLDIVGGAFAGLVLLLYVTKNFITSYYEAKKTIRAGSSDPLLTAMGATWDRGQMERILQACERMAACLESIAAEQKNETADDLKRLLARLDKAELLDLARRHDEEEERRHGLPRKR